MCLALVLYWWLGMFGEIKIHLDEPGSNIKDTFGDHFFWLSKYYQGLLPAKFLPALPFLQHGEDMDDCIGSNACCNTVKADV